MLKTLFRALAVALLIVTVPVQGFAAASAGICMALGHHDGDAAAHDLGSGDSGHHHDHGTPADPHHEGGVGHCAPCVSCCAAAAIASLPSTVLQERTVSPLVPGPLVSSYGVAPQRLDRPPLAL